MADTHDDSREDLTHRFWAAVQRMNDADIAKDKAYTDLVRGRNSPDLSVACTHFRENAKALQREATTVIELGQSPALTGDRRISNEHFSAGVILSTEQLDTNHAASLCAPTRPKIIP